ncbi:hypothetical protein [Pseudovibrio sp. Tun.PSC04-5.I4]|uniref:hypothetical protein n=1 Tax=Pseudovibrio sp. Tun.PSC04-5.I4 TaxID=1798213 RepID=UPI000B81E53C|nr:hypothetical protein [Pseudovibrio sp. Tun.PSC04-5.I4]
MKINCLDDEGQNQRFENITAVKTTADGLVVETLLDGTKHLPGKTIVGVDCSQGEIYIATFATKDQPHA